MALTRNISAELRAYNDLILNAQALPNNTNWTSSAFRLGGVQGAVELVFKFIAAATITNTKQLLIQVLMCATEDGSFGATEKDTLTMYDATAGVGTITFAAAEELRMGIPTDALAWGKIKITTTENLASNTADAYLGMVSR
jgi:hypothetical protein